MLAIVSLFLALCTPVSIESPQTLSEKLVAAGKSKGWERDVEFNDARPSLVHMQVASSGRRIDIFVGMSKSAPALAKDLRQERKNPPNMSEIEELRLSGTGLIVEVPDFSTKRISNMKAYAGAEMRISGIVKGRVVVLYLKPAVKESPMSPEDAYDDVVAFGKLVFSDLKK
jgi:hypothetical protein